MEDTNKVIAYYPNIGKNVIVNDVEDGKAYIHAPCDPEHYERVVNVSDLRRTDETSPIYLVVKDGKEVLA